MVKPDLRVLATAEKLRRSEVSLAGKLVLSDAGADADADANEPSNRRVGKNRHAAEPQNRTEV